MLAAAAGTSRREGAPLIAEGSAVEAARWGVGGACEVETAFSACATRCNWGCATSTDEATPTFGATFADDSCGAGVPVCGAARRIPPATARAVGTSIDTAAG